MQLGQRTEDGEIVVACTLHQLETDPAEIQSLGGVQHVNCSIHVFCLFSSFPIFSRGICNVGSSLVGGIEGDEGKEEKKPVVK